MTTTQPQSPPPTFLVRHGDLVIRSAPIPLDATRLKHRVLAEGETTGHAHRMSAGLVLEAKDKSARYIQLKAPAVLTHEEHGPIEVPAGTFEVVYQREYTPAAIIRVMD